MRPLQERPATQGKAGAVTELDASAFDEIVVIVIIVGIIRASEGTGQCPYGLDRDQGFVRVVWKWTLVSGQGGSYSNCL